MSSSEHCSSPGSWPKRPYLVKYDYGMGAAWAFLLAKSRAEIEEKLPELIVHEYPPASWSPSDVERIRSTMTIDIDDSSNRFLAALNQDRDNT